MLAAGCDIVHASQMTGWNVEQVARICERLDSIGCVLRPQACGPKNLGNKKALSAVVDDLYSRFIDIVDEGRPRLTRAQVEALADGRIYSANQALEAGLVDHVGHLDDAIDHAERLAHLSTSKVVAYRAGGRSARNIYSGISSETPSAPEINIFSFGASSLPAGFYYLWPMALP